VAQDTCLALWDLSIEEDSSYVGSAGQTGIK
jgi:hypothetical protein